MLQQVTFCSLRSSIRPGHLIGQHWGEKLPHGSICTWSKKQGIKVTAFYYIYTFLSVATKENHEECKIIRTKAKTKTKKQNKPPKQQKPKPTKQKIPNPSTTKNKQHPKTLKSKSTLHMTEAMADGINISN